MRWGSRNLLILTSLVLIVAVGAAAAIESALAPHGGPGLPTVWWTAYALTVVALLMLHDALPRPRWCTESTLLIALSALSAVLVLLFASQGWLALTFVLTVTMAAFAWPARRVAVLIGVQTALTVVTGLLGGWSTVDLILGPVIFGISQFFGALVVFTARSEADARRELTAAHAELRSTVAMLAATTREAERLRIARDLHDIVGHHLTALSLELEVAGHLTRAEPGGEHIQRARMIAKELLRTIRDAVGRMRADGSPLEPALRELADGAPGLRVTVQLRDVPALDPEQTMAVLRCVQEAITNTLRHAGARTSRVEMDGSADVVRVIVTDDGAGTDRIVLGHGLTGMHERFKSLGGELQVQSARGSGFTVTGILPLVPSVGAVHDSGQPGRPA
ncbi:sensor histidine kinase [Agrococcus baldri]|uniref:Signal transduction histidine kinase n=1 Tax=Agrococcus baldri TaxID=153730 RepID=A0AA87RJP7_9MICO|nr:sensor histidine kinase [Agrococcus baldri]GEK79422.1 hypothetical protein ABA31_07730 [Agrococcus baldri]